MQTSESGPSDAAEATAPQADAGKKAGRRRRSASADDPADGAPASRAALPLVPTLAVLLVLLLAGAGYLWFTRPAGSAVQTGAYGPALQAARSGVVDFTSFDYLTLDDDIEQIRRIATGDLLEEGVAELDGSRQSITDAQAAVSTEVLDGGVTRVTDDAATVLLVIESQQKSSASEQVQVVRYRIEVNLERGDDDRWLLSGIKGTETGDE